MDSITSRVSPKVLVILSIGFLLFVIALFALFSQMNQTPQNEEGKTRQEQNDGQNPSNSSTSGVGSKESSDSVKLPPPEPGVIVRVGEELLYESDLNYELSYYPYEITTEVQNEIMDKMILDSIVLQSAAREDLVTLNATIFNSPQKDYAKRIEALKQIRDQMNERAVAFEGAYIAIWFHNGEPGPAGYERGKQIAMEKITALRNQIVSGSLTIEQAGQQIKADTSLQELDLSYTSNAYITFSVNGNNKITIDSKVDAAIKKLKAGEVSPVLVLTDSNAVDKPIEAAYIVAFMSESGENSPGFEAWRDARIRQFAVERYE